MHRKGMALLRRPQTFRDLGCHQEEQVSQREKEAKEKQDVGTLKRGRTGDLKVVRNSPM